MKHFDPHNYRIQPQMSSDFFNSSKKLKKKKVEVGARLR